MNSPTSARDRGDTGNRSIPGIGFVFAGNSEYLPAPALGVSRDIFEVVGRIVVFRRGENAGERKPGETSGDEIVRMMVGK